MSPAAATGASCHRSLSHTTHNPYIIFRGRSAHQPTSPSAHQPTRAAHLLAEHVVVGEAVVGGAVVLQVGVLDRAVAHGRSSLLHLLRGGVGPGGGWVSGWRGWMGSGQRSAGAGGLGVCMCGGAAAPAIASIAFKPMAQCTARPPTCAPPASPGCGAWPHPAAPPGAPPAARQRQEQGSGRRGAGEAGQAKQVCVCVLGSVAGNDKGPAAGGVAPGPGQVPLLDVAPGAAPWGACGRPPRAPLGAGGGGVRGWRSAAQAAAGQSRPNPPTKQPASAPPP